MTKPKASPQTAIDKLPYRPGAGIMLINEDKKIFGGKRIDNPGNAWQMPQGGIDFGELPEEAALRELHEETGIKANLVEVLAQSGEWITYELPDELRGKLWKGKFRGQEQLWFAMLFRGSDADVNITLHKPEFSEWNWFAPDDLIKHIVPFKRDLYTQVFEEFAEYL